MRNKLYAALAASCAMLMTSGLVAFATAAPKAPTAAEAELSAHLDEVIRSQLDRIEVRLAQK